MASTSRGAGPRRGAVAVVIAIGVGLALAPVAFQMFTRAPEGGRMIDDFRPHMTASKIDRFDGYLDQIGAAEAQATEATGGSGARFPALADLHRQWPVIESDMRDMLADMRRNLGRFEGIDALPPFVLFPWFFVIPGVLAAVLGISTLVAARRGKSVGGRLRVVALLGVGLMLAPVAFQMFGRAPGGARMIDDFRPLMTAEKVTSVQGYFLVIGVAEGEVRTEVLPARAEAQAPPLAAVEEFVRDWPRISNEMAPMIGTMADNVDNFAAVDALPPFWLFPWFFVVPGLLVTGLALAADRHGRARLIGRAPARALPLLPLLAVGLVVVLIASGCGGDDGGDGDAAAPAGEGNLVGLFRVEPGKCDTEAATGSYFRMVQPGGTVADGPFVINGDSPCQDKTLTPLEPGTDGGLLTGSYQPQPGEPFDGAGNAVSDRLTRPQRWFAVTFALATNERDPQTDRDATAPRLVVSDGQLSGDLSALAAAWNGQHFNQGSPKPGGERPGNTTGPEGTYDPDTGAYTLEWSSQIVGGPFNNFTGTWHLEGTFEST
ncbi:MAG: hypothetical protein ACRDJP_06750 [Actinomycetota bacterium]